VAVLNGVSGAVELRSPSHRPDALPRLPRRLLVIQDRRRIVRAERLAHLGVHPPGRVETGVGHRAQLGHPAADEDALGVLIQPLLDRVVDADGVDAGDAGLHLRLRVVDARLVIGEAAGEEQRRLAPVQPEVVARHRHQHRAHAEVDPTRLGQVALAGVHKRPAGAARTPGLEAHGIEFVLAQAVVGGVGVLELQPRLALELLHEVAVPVQPAEKRPQRARRAGRRGRVLAQRPQPRLAGLGDLAQRERAPGQMR
jgi:hypothetical protein